MLTLEGVSCRYGKVTAVDDVSLDVGGSELVCLIGSNGAGKTTVLRAVSGLMPIASGAIRFGEIEISNMKPAAIVGQGVAHCPEERKLWPQLTVSEHLRMGAFQRGSGADVRDDEAQMFEIFPRLAERRGQLAGTLSGGEQQMVAIARALMSRPRLLLMDEPSLGLAPVIVDQLIGVIARIRSLGTAILLVEQNAALALAVADRAYVLENGRLSWSGSAEELRNDPRISDIYLGAA